MSRSMSKYFITRLMQAGITAVSLAAAIANAGPCSATDTPADPHELARQLLLNTCRAVPTTAFAQPDGSIEGHIDAHELARRILVGRPASALVNRRQAAESSASSVVISDPHLRVQQLLSHSFN